MRVQSGDQTGSSSFQIAGGVSWVTPLPSSPMTKILLAANAIRPSAFPLAVLAAIRGAVGAASRSQPAADARTRSAPMLWEVFIMLQRCNRCAAFMALQPCHDVRPPQNQYFSPAFSAKLFTA